MQYQVLPTGTPSAVVSFRRFGICLRLSSHKTLSWRAGCETCHQWLSERSIQWQTNPFPYFQQYLQQQDLLMPL